MAEEIALTLVRRLARNNLWANHRLLAACAKLGEADYGAQRPCFFGSIHGTLNHILDVDRLYLDRLEDRRPTPTPYGVELCADLVSLTGAQDKEDRRLVALVDGLDTAGLARVVSWVNRQGEETASPVHAVLLHLFQHQIHHRGQVHDLLAQTDVPPPQLDEFFLEEDAAARAEDLKALGVG